MRRLPSTVLLPLLLLALASAGPGTEADPAAAAQIHAGLTSTVGDERVAALRQLGEQRGNTALRLIHGMLGHPDPSTRAEAVAAICAIDRKAGQPALTKALHDKDGTVRAAALRLLARLDGAQALVTLLRAQEDKDVQVRRALVDVLLALAPTASTFQAKQMAEAACTMVAAADIHLGLAILDLAQALPGETGRGVLLVACCLPIEELAVRAAGRIAAAGWGESAAKGLALRLQSATPAVRQSGLVALSILGQPAAVPTALANLGQREAGLRCAALECIAACSEGLEAKAALRYEQPVLAMLTDRDWGVRATAAETLARIGSPKAPGPLIELLARTTEPDALAVNAALTALSATSGLTLTQAKEWAAWWRSAAKDFAPTRSGPPTETSTIYFYELTDTVTSAQFVIDISGSMRERGPAQGYKGEVVDSKYQGAKAELLRTVFSLSGGTRFNVVLFRHQVEPWRDGPVRATWRSKRALQLTLDQIAPDNGTNTHEALVQTFAQPPCDAIFLLTDGMPTVGVTDPQRIIADVTAWNAAAPRRVRLHAIAFYLEEAKDFLSRLAEGNGGQYRLVN